MRSSASIFGNLAVGVLVVATPLSGQGFVQFDSGWTSEATSQDLRDLGHWKTPIDSGFQEQPGQKNPFLAGLLSAYVPGLGSFYAGNAGHGKRHLAITGGSFALMFVGLAEGGESGAVPFYLGLATYFVNCAWSVVTAAADANADNQRGTAGGASTRLFDDVFVEPSVRLLSGKPGPMAGFWGDSRAELQLVRIRF